jgi:hypothetical protein
VLVDDGAAIKVVGNHIDVALSLAVGRTLVGGAIVGDGVEVGASAVVGDSLVVDTAGTEVGVAVGNVSLVVATPVDSTLDGTVVGGVKVESLVEAPVDETVEAPVVGIEVSTLDVGDTVVEPVGSVVT